MKRKVLISVLALVVCLTLVGCGKKDETKGSKSNNKGGNATPAASVAPAEKTITDAAKDAAKNYRIRPEEIGVEFNVIDGYYIAENSNLELRIYVDKEYTKDEKKELHGKVLDYFKSITDDAIVKLEGFAHENVEELSYIQALIDWIAEQNELQNYPNFGTDCEVDEIRTSEETPKLEAINAQVSPALAMYSVTIQITYVDNSKKLWR